MGLFCKVAPRSNANILARIGYMLLYLSNSACSALEMEREKNHEGRIKWDTLKINEYIERSKDEATSCEKKKKTCQLDS